MSSGVPRSSRWLNPDGALFAAVAILVAIYIARIGPYWNISPDSATYVGLARALVAGEPYARGSIQPPVTSLVYAVVLFFFPDGYTALNAATVLLICLALACAFALVRRHAGRTQAFVVVLLSLASVRFYAEGSQLLSEPSYMLFSMAALWLLDRPPSVDATDDARPLSRRDTMLAGTFMIVTVLTRAVGLALVLAVLVAEGWRVVRRRGSANVLLAGFAAAAVVAVVLWEMVGSRSSYAADWFRMFLLRDASPGDAGGLSLSSLFSRVGENRGALPAVGALLMNSWRSPSDWLNVLLPVGGTILFLAGLFQSLRRRVTVSAIYVLIYVGVVTAHSVVGGFIDQRYLVSVLPLLIHFSLEAARGLISWVSLRLPRFDAARATLVLGTVYVALYTAVAIEPIRQGVADAHSSPFGAYPIKRPSNFDLQRVAMWMAEHAGPDDTFASWQRDMIEVLAERRGYALSDKLVTPADSLTGWLEAQHIRFLVVDHRSGSRGDSLVAAVRRHPGAFQLVTALRNASLYEVRPRPD